MDKTFSISRHEEPTRLLLKNFRNKGLSTDVDIQYDEVFLEACKKDLGKDDLSPEDLSAYISDLIEKAIHGRDGYKMEIEDDEEGVT
jgi:hypothetical protein